VVPLGGERMGDASKGFLEVIDIVVSCISLLIF
jgi:hypothetical protein